DRPDYWMGYRRRLRKYAGIVARSIICADRAGPMTNLIGCAISAMTQTKNGFTTGRSSFAIGWVAGVGTTAGIVLCGCAPIVQADSGQARSAAPTAPTAAVPTALPTVGASAYLTAPLSDPGAGAGLRLAPAGSVAIPEAVAREAIVKQFGSLPERFSPELALY